MCVNAYSRKWFAVFLLSFAFQVQSSSNLAQAQLHAASCFKSNQAVLRVKHRSHQDKHELSAVRELSNVQHVASRAVLAQANSGSTEMLCASSQNPCAELKRKARKKGYSHFRRLSNFTCSKNYEVHLLTSPNDAYYSNLKGLNLGKRPDINAPQAWDLSTGSSSIVVGIVDTGIDYAHEDLSANIWVNPSEVPNNGEDDDGNGIVDDIYGAGFVGGNSSNDNYDDNGHGTHVAGTIGAAGNNGIGVVGVNWNVKLVSAKFLDANGSGDLFAAVLAIDYLTGLKNAGVNIVAMNNSWGGGDYSESLEASIQSSRDAGIVFVAAAGNESNNNDIFPSYPCDYDVDNVVSVGAHDTKGKAASFSNYGGSVDISAPGVSILSTYPGNQYEYLSGTSMATPHVSGALALLKSYDSSLSWFDLIQRLYATAVHRKKLARKVAAKRALDLERLLKNIQTKQR